MLEGIALTLIVELLVVLAACSRYQVRLVYTVPRVWLREDDGWGRPAVVPRREDDGS